MRQETGVRKPAAHQQRRSARRGRLYLLAALGLAAMAALVFVFLRFAPVAGRLYPRGTETLELREETLSPKQYYALRERFPDREILWSIPLDGSRYDCGAESLTLSALSPEETELLALFPALKELDIREADIDPDACAALRAALPDCHIRWSIPIGAGRYDSAAQEIKVTDFSADEAERFLLFDDLRRVDATGCDCYGALLALNARHPELALRWQVPLCGRVYGEDAVKLQLDAGADYDEVSERLAYLPALESVRTGEGVFSPEEQAALMEKYPRILFLWPVELCGQTFFSGARTLSFAGREDMGPADLTAIQENAFRFPRLQTVDLTGCGFASARLSALDKALSGPVVRWTFDLCGVTVCSTDSEIDLSGYKISDLSVVEAALPYLKNVKKVVMCRCGPSDEEMDALSRKYEDIRFVWSIRLGNNWIRTDETAFINTKLSLGRLHDWHTGALHYCTDMIALDLGHNFISDISFVASMPHLRYFIVAENPVRDYSPLAGLKELVYLELFQTGSMDLSPLLECPALEDLNLCHIPCEGTAAFEVLSQMTWLKRLWYSGNRMTEAQQQALREALPDCEMMLKRGQESTVDPWRISDNYFEMRDIFGMYYMNGYGDQVGRRTLDEQY